MSAPGPAHRNPPRRPWPRPAQVTAAVTAGHSYTFTLTSHDDNYSVDPAYTLDDDVTLQ